MIDRRLAIAPMMDCTDRYFRRLARVVSRKVLLYTEMIHCRAILHGDRARHLDFDAAEHPVAIQLGGSAPADLAAAARVAQDWGYDEINLNVGCPSDRVQSGRFGACLMLEPDLVAECVAAMRAAVSVPVTVKCRIGVDDKDRYDDLLGFVDTVAGAGCDTFMVHARKAWLSGLSPKENREIPPLRHDEVLRLKSERPHLSVSINGGIADLAEAQAFLEAGLDGVAIGRAAYSDVYRLADADRLIYGADAVTLTRTEIVEAFRPAIAGWLAEGVPLKRAARHMVGLFHGVPGARQWRRALSENAPRAGAGMEVIDMALAVVASAEAAAYTRAA
jgi:tRNA-dihydrouridine synthase A